MCTQNNLIQVKINKLDHFFAIKFVVSHSLHTTTKAECRGPSKSHGKPHFRVDVEPRSIT